MKPVVHTATTPYKMWTNTYEPRCNVPPPQSNPVLHTPTTPCEFDMWMHTYEPRSDVPPIKPSATESYYTMFVSHVNECICNQITCTHPLVGETSSTKPYYTIAV